MKKLSLNIKEPCHENWDAMTQQEKGKFCGSCQKTVIDFTNMSDRQIAEFFKKPAGSVCGRFYQDQLQRPMEIPKKRIPWVKYFFHVTWPAFVFFLKGCNEKLKTMGDIAIQAPHEKPNNDLEYATLGFVLPEITAIDSSKGILNSPVVDECSIVGIIAIEPNETTIMGDTIAMPVQNTEILKEEIKQAKDMDTVNIIGYQNGRSIACGGVITGAVLVDTGIKIQSNTDQIKRNDLSNDTNITVYPNPVRAGSQITIILSPGNLISQLQLFSSSGAMIKTNLVNNQSDVNNKFSLPASITPGAYFLRIILDNEKVKTAKLIVTN